MKTTDTTDEQFEYFMGVEKEYKANLPYTSQIERMLLEDSPEIMKDFPVIIEELDKKRSRLESEIQRHLKRITKYDENTRIFVEALIKFFPVMDLVAIEQSISRLKGYIAKTHNKGRKKTFVDANQIQQAREASIIELAETHLREVRKAGVNMVALCPFHQEKKPSLTLFTKTNSWYCFGCHKGGDVIALVRELLNLSFCDAVNYLTH